MKSTAIKQPNERVYEVVRRPVITEKTTFLSQDNKYVFDVASDATKSEVRQAIETLFDVRVTKVNILNNKGKVKRFRGRKGQRSDVRRAIATLKQGDTIDTSVEL